MAARTKVVVLSSWPGVGMNRVPIIHLTIATQMAGTRPAMTKGQRLPCFTILVPAQPAGQLRWNRSHRCIRWLIAT